MKNIFYFFVFGIVLSSCIKKDNRHIHSDKLRQTYCLANDLLYNNPYVNIDLIGCEDKDGIYGYISPQSIPAYYEYAINDSINSLMKPEFRRLLKDKVAEEANPIIFYYEYKK